MKIIYWNIIRFKLTINIFILYMIVYIIHFIVYYNLQYNTKSSNNIGENYIKFTFVLNLITYRVLRFPMWNPNRLENCVNFRVDFCNWSLLAQPFNVVWPKSFNISLEKTENVLKIQWVFIVDRCSSEHWNSEGVRASNNSKGPLLKSHLVRRVKTPCWQIGVH